MSTSADYFELLYSDPDPYCYRSRWYEERKRNLLLAVLPKKQYAHAWEVGCSNGHLTVDLASRCDALLATDVSERAVDLAKSAVGKKRNVVIDVANHPDDWPSSSFDLIVFGEIGYYLDHHTLARTCRKLAVSLTPGGLLVACHWVRPFEESASNGSDIHQLIDKETALSNVFLYEDADFHLQGWSRNTMSVAQMEGIA